ncbi:phosphoribosyl-AMP cyclohydrolase [Patescibacteria group bacterium]|nr:phosphoribosyl-AMP cyclohydrolase [Patescibacteria group bacterium]
MNELNFKKKGGLVPVVVQEMSSGKVLMLGYCNEDSLRMTIKTGNMYFWSRTKRRLWMKGESSGNRLKVREIIADCDNDALLIKAEVVGERICHTGSKSCFFRKL